MIVLEETITQCLDCGGPLASDYVEADRTGHDFCFLCESSCEDCGKQISKMFRYCQGRKRIRESNRL